MPRERGIESRLTETSTGDLIRFMKLPAYIITSLNASFPRISGSRASVLITFGATRLNSTMSSSPTQYDVVIVGSGQSGTPLAGAFARAGRKVALIDRAYVGGCCVNVGCTPTKTMISSGRVAYLARRGADYGVHTSSLTIDMAKIRQRKRDIVARFSGGSEKRLLGAGVDILKGEAKFVGDKTLTVRMNSGGEERTVAGEVVILDVGERPARPDLPGLSKVDASLVLDSTSIMELGQVPKHLIVLGGGYIGLEFGQLFRRLGAEVTVVQRAARLAPREDEDISQSLLEILREDGIQVHLSTSAESISQGGDGTQPLKLRIKPESAASLDLSGSHILIATGRTPNTDSLNLDAVGVKTDKRGYLVVDDKLLTSAAGVYGLGDAHGGPAFTHISYDDFRILRANLLPDAVPSTTPKMHTTKDSVSRNLVPYVMYTDPQLAHIGLQERELKASGRKYKRATMPMSYVARALETDETRGLMKATVDAETGEILGFTCLGIEGGEIMAVVQTAMMGGVKWWDLEAAVWAHPSLAEALNNLWGYLE